MLAAGEHSQPISKQQVQNDANRPSNTETVSVHSCNTTNAFTDACGWTAGFRETSQFPQK